MHFDQVMVFVGLIADNNGLRANSGLSTLQRKCFTQILAQRYNSFCVIKYIHENFQIVQMPHLDLLHFAQREQNVLKGCLRYRSKEICLVLD